MAGLPRRIIKVTAQTGFGPRPMLASARAPGRATVCFPPQLLRGPRHLGEGSGLGGEATSRALRRGRRGHFRPPLDAGHLGLAEGDEAAAGEAWRLPG